MNKYMKYGIEFVVFMIIFTVVDMRTQTSINWIMNILFSMIIVIAQMLLDKRRNQYMK